MPASEPAFLATSNRGLAYLIAGLIHAAAMLLAFPPVGWWPLAFIAPMPLIWTAWARAQDLRSGRRRGLGRAPLMFMVGMAPLHLYAQQWVMDVSAAGYIPFVVIMCGFSGVLVWGLSVVVAKWPRLPLVVVGPVMWSAMEFFRGELFLSGYPWVLSGHPLIDAPLFPGVASLLGTYFAGYLVAVVAAAGVDALAEDGRGRLGLASLGVVGLVVVVSVIARPVEPEKREVKFGVVQTNIPQSNKLEWTFGDRLKDFERFRELTRQAAAGRPDVIVWPETMFPGISLSAQAVAEERAAQLTFQVPESVDARGEVSTTVFHDHLLELSKDVGVPMLIGALGFDKFSIKPDPSGGVMFAQDARYNSVFLVDAGMVDAVPYSKLELTPFGEVMPGIRHWPWLQSKVMAVGAGGMTFDLSSGPGPRAFTVGIKPVLIVTPICFEATKPRLCRKLVRAAGPGQVIMVNLTNDGWFGRFRTGRLQHLQVARWRCVELGVPMVRAANTGVSCAIDSRGRVMASGVNGFPGAWNQDGVLHATVAATSARTLYARIGEVFGWGVFVLGTGLFGAALLTGRRTPRKEVQA
jgi:apolipoprotein N-acyltransferase